MHAATERRRIGEMRTRARSSLEDGAVTQSYKADRKAVIRLLNEALATELVCVLRYRRHYYMASGIHGPAVADEFLEHADQELGHADEIAKRIVQLGGEPDLDPATLLGRSHAEYVPGVGLSEMIRENLVAERIAIESYAGMIRYLGGKDSTTRTMLERILAVEEEHAEDMADLLKDFEPPA